MAEIKDTIDAEAQRMYFGALLERGYKFKAKTWHFGKPYVWIQAPDGELFMERLPLEDAEQP